MHTRTAYVLIFTLAAITIAGWSLAFIGLPTTPSAKSTLSEGLTKQDVNVAYADPAIRAEKGLQSILLFSKSGGALEDGNIQPKLKVDSEVKVNETKQIKLQYFVDIRDDLTGSSIAHCSDVKLHISLDGREVFVTEWLGYENRNPTLPLNTEKITINEVSPGIHLVSLIPEGRISGCNHQGYVFSWSGIMAIYD